MGEYKRLTNIEFAEAEKAGNFGHLQAYHDACDEVERLRSENDRLQKVYELAQATLTALNTGQVGRGSPLHLKLREVLMDYRMKQEKG